MPGLEDYWVAYRNAYDPIWYLQAQMGRGYKISELVAELREAKAKADQALFDYFEAFDADQRERFPDYFER